MLSVATLHLVIHSSLVDTIYICFGSRLLPSPAKNNITVLHAVTFDVSAQPTSLRWSRTFINIHNYITAQQDHVPLNWTRRREREPIPDLPLHNGKVDTTHRFPPPVVTINHLCLYIHIYACGDRLYSPRAIVIVILSSYTIWLGSKCKLIPKWSRNLSQPVPICSTMCLRSSLEASNPKEVLVLSQEPTIHSNHHHSEVSSRYRNLSAVPRSQGHLYLPNW